MCSRVLALAVVGTSFAGATYTFAPYCAVVHDASERFVGYICDCLRAIEKHTWVLAAVTDVFSFAERRFTKGCMLVAFQKANLLRRFYVVIGLTVCPTAVRKAFGTPQLLTGHCRQSCFSHLRNQP